MLKFCVYYPEVKTQIHLYSNKSIFTFLKSYSKLFFISFPLDNSMFVLLYVILHDLYHLLGSNHHPANSSKIGRTRKIVKMLRATLYNFLSFRHFVSHQSNFTPYSGLVPVLLSEVPGSTTCTKVQVQALTYFK